MRFCVLGSGSKGNATYVEAGGRALLIDNGFSGVELERRVAAAGFDIAKLAAVLITHEHGDHIRGAGVVARKYDISLYVNPATFRQSAHVFGKVPSVREFSTGTSFMLNDFHVHPFAVSHDTADPVGFVIENQSCSLGYCTDTGIVSRLIQHRLSSCNGIVIECNHDPEMLKSGPYPLSLQQRVRSKQGHLANADAARFLLEIMHDKLQHVVLAHISEKNNNPSLAFDTVAAAINAQNGVKPVLSLAWQHKSGQVVTLKSCLKHDVS